MSKQIGEFKDALDRGVQIKLSSDGATLLVSGPEGVISLNRGGANRLADLLIRAQEDDAFLDPPKPVEAKAATDPAVETKPAGEKKSKQK